MNDSIPMDQIIDLGQFFVGALKGNSAGEVSQHCVNVARLLHVCDLSGIATILDQTISPIFQPNSPLVLPKILSDVNQRLFVLNHQMMAEAHKKQMIALATSDVATELRDLPTKRPRLTDTQMKLLEETIRCLEVQAFRSATVMGWNLAYDIVRQWIFDNHLTQFNTDLTAKYPSMGVQIAAYSDWFDGKPTEYQVLDACKQNIITGRVNDRLGHYLRERNDCGHANFKNPTMERTNGYIQSLLEIVNDKPFI
jgi:hypothetical protein